MELNENDRFDDFLLDSKNTKLLEFALNKILKKKYNWINSINLKVVIQDRFTQGFYIYFGGKISVDETWGKQMWETYHSEDFPGNKNHNYELYEGLYLSDILPENIIENLSKNFTQIAKSIVPFQREISYSRINNMMIYFENNNKNINLKEHIRRILKEATKINPFLRRRLGMLDYEVEYRLSAIYRPDNICQYKNGDELVEVVMEAAIESMYWNYFADIDENSEKWVNTYYDMVKYIRDKYGDKIKEYYHINCGD